MRCNSWRSLCGWGTIYLFTLSLVWLTPARLLAQQAPSEPEAQPALAVEQVAPNAPAVAEQSAAPPAKTQTAPAEKKETRGMGEARKPIDAKATPAPTSTKIKKKTKESASEPLYEKEAGRDKDRFDLDYAPSDAPLVNDEEKSVPFYKHWIFWTIIGAVAVAGIVVGVKYGVDTSDSMTIEVTR